jgi:hypothetical protein
MTNPLPADGQGWNPDDRACLTLSGYWTAGPERTAPERDRSGPELEREA